MRKNKQILLTLLVTLALIALAWSAGQGRKNTPQISVWAAQSDIAAGSRISADQLMEIKIPANLQTKSLITNPVDAIGQWSTAPLMKGELLSSQRLARSAEGLVYPDPGPGRRLLTIKLEAAAANGFWLAPGTHVDICLIPRNRTGLNDIQILENIRIMDIIGGKAESGGLAASSGNDPLICLDLNLEQARLLSSAQGLYDFRLTAINEPKPAGDSERLIETAEPAGIVAAD